MRSTSVAVSIRYSKPMLDGSHKTVELSCEATLNNSEETWQEAQTTLYKQLGEQMRYVFNGNGKAEAKEPPQKKLPVLPKPHWCSEHNQEFKKRNGPHGEFYSHRIKDTRDWCNEKATT